MAAITLAKVKKELKSSKGFIAYLGKMKPGAIAGERDICHRCPLTWYLRSLGLTNVTVYKGSMLFWIGSKMHEIPNPSWAIEFIDNVDDKTSKHDSITAGKCLRFLS